MSHLANLSAVVGLLLPLVIAVIQQTHWREDLRAGVGFVCCLAAAAITAWAEGKFTGKDILSSFLICYTLAQTSYHALWTKVGVAQMIETATTRPRGDPALAHKAAVTAPSEAEKVQAGRARKRP